MSITVAESLVMELLWAKSPRPSDELIAELGPSENWSETTVRTLLARLVKKGAVAAEPEGRLFQGQIGPFVAQFSEREKLTAADVAHLKRLIQDYEDEQ
jgi:predicted transcriptional regulator